MLEIHIEQQGQTAIVELAGQLNSTTTIDVQDQVLALAETNQNILLDMNRVTYLSSAGLRLLLLLYRRINDNHGMLALSGLTEEITDIMAMTGFLDLFTIYENRADALEALKKAG
jgi:anti-sigma B factor antagonist